MAEVKDHICSGPNCIFCEIMANDRVIGLTVANEQLLSGLKAGEPGISIQSTDSKGLGNQIEQLEKLAFYDQLTGLFNIHVFVRELKEEVARCCRYKRPLSIGALCIDNYLEIKTKYGPLGCELVLKHIGHLLLNLLREVDIVARLQADQFVFILPETNEAGASIVAERIRQSVLKKPVKVNTLVLDITASMGIASFPKHGQDIDTLLQSCLTAQTEAINKGGNRVCLL